MNDHLGRADKMGRHLTRQVDRLLQQITGAFAVPLIQGAQIDQRALPELGGMHDQLERMRRAGGKIVAGIMLVQVLIGEVKFQHARLV